MSDRDFNGTHNDGRSKRKQLRFLFTKLLGALYLRPSCCLSVQKTQNKPQQQQQTTQNDNCFSTLTHALFTAPDGIGNVSPSSISLKLQFTWIFVGVLGADCSLMLGPSLTPLPLHPAPLRGLRGASISPHPQSLKVTCLSDMFVLSFLSFFFFLNIRVRVKHSFPSVGPLLAARSLL